MLFLVVFGSVVVFLIMWAALRVASFPTPVPDEVQTYLATADLGPDATDEMEAVIGDFD